MYDTKKILKKLKLNQQEFRELCILSGSDYTNKNEKSNNDNSNNDNSNIKTIHSENNYHRYKLNKSIYYYYELYNNFNNQKNESVNNNKNIKNNGKTYFYDFLDDNNESINYKNLITICELFNVNDNEELIKFQTNNKENLNRKLNNNFKKTINKTKLREILKEDGFIFLN